MSGDIVVGSVIPLADVTPMTSDWRVFAPSGFVGERKKITLTRKDVVRVVIDEVGKGHTWIGDVDVSMICNAVTIVSKVGDATRVVITLQAMRAEIEAVAGEIELDASIIE